MDSTDSETAAPAAAAEIPRTRGLLRQRQFTEALAASEALLADTPEQRDGLLFAAIAQRNFGRIARRWPRSPGCSGVIRTSTACTRSAATVS